jgi:uncharacterized repeat protein (TIGR01451 family)
MRPRSFLAFALILSLLVVPCVQLALAAQSSSTSTSSTTTTTTTTSTSSAPKSPFSEKLDIYTAGSNGYWLVSLSPVNATKSAIVAAESVAGISAYELTAIKSSSAATGAQLFWGDGYRVLKLPFIPQAGVFLNVTATSQSAARSAAADFDSFLGTNLVQIASGGGNYTFFSPADFTVAGGIIFTSVPVAEKGLAALTSASTLATTPTPTAILTGVRSGSSFTHTVTFGSSQSNVVGTDGSLNLAKAINQANASFRSSPSATSTQVVLHSLDGLISSNDSAKITNDKAAFSGTYSISVPSDTVYRPNITLLQDPPVLTATRILDRGSASSADLVSVTLTLRNTGQVVPIRNIAMNDSWWAAYPSLFSLSAGNATFNVKTLNAGQNISKVYVLKVISTASQDLTLPSAKVSYSYSSGGVAVNSTTITNQVELRTNSIGPALMIQAGTDIPSGSPLGKAGRYVVSVTNIGNGPALDLQVGNFTNPTLSQGGAVWKVNTTLSFNGIVDRNLTQTFTVGWTAPDGSKASLVSNPARIILSHSGILAPNMQFTMSASLTPSLLKLGTINATYTLTNAGSLASGNVSVTQTFAAGMLCKKVLNGTANCTASAFSLNTGPVAAGSNVVGRLLMNFSRDNYLSEPGSVTTTKAGVTLHTTGSAFLVPAGVDVTRTDSPNPVFAGQNDTVTVKVVNLGSLPVYNASVKTNPDAFDKALSGSLHQAYGVLGPTASQSFNYSVEALTPGNHTTASISVGFAFAGFTAAYTVFPNNVMVYKDVQAQTSTKPATPVEGTNFLLSVDVQNPSSADVTNVSVTIPIPQGLTVVNASSGLQVKGHAVTLSVASLAAGAASSHSITLRAGTDGTINLGNGSLTFQYLGTTIKGVVLAPAIVVGVDLLLRYELPIGVAVLLTIAVATYVHRNLAVPQTK